MPSTTITTTTINAAPTTTATATTAAKKPLAKLATTSTNQKPLLPHPLPPPVLQTSARGTPFERAVWSLTAQIPRGSFSTYALLARQLGTSPRAVGNALRRNPFAPTIPW